MGLTIHYQGQLHDEAAYADFLATANRFAIAHKWPAHAIVEPSRQLTRTLQPEDPNAPEVEELYEGPTRGLILLPHSDCEPLAFEFDRDLFMQDTCKTQFAGPEIHASILHLFRETESLFAMLDIHDEAAFWDTADTPDTRATLAEIFTQTRAAIAEAAAETPSSNIAVLTPSGRILDILAD